MTGLRKLPDPPTDGITALSYFTRRSAGAAPSEYLASTSWDGCLRVHDTGISSEEGAETDTKLLTKQNMDSGPLLSLATCNSGNTLFTGGLDGSVRTFDIESSKVSTIGYHSPHNEIPVGDENDLTVNVACSCLSSMSFDTTTGDATQVIASAGWDSNFYLWDVRNSSSKPVAKIKLPDKAFSMDVDPSKGNRIAIATSGRRLCVIDVKMMKQDGPLDAYQADMVLNRESSLKFQSRVCRFFPDGIGLAVGSIEGRVAVEFLNELGVSSKDKKRYAFKCHRSNDIVYPVNAIAFHPTFGTFATGGCDGTTVTWDGLNKKKLTVLPKVPTSVAALAFNGDGTELAIASSYTFEEGERDAMHSVPDEIYVKTIADVEVKPKLSK